VRQLTLDGVEIAVHASATEAAIATKSDRASITEVVTGVKRTAGGYRWEFVSEDHKTDRKAPATYRHQQTPVQQMDLHGVVLSTYPCLKDAVAATNGRAGDISKAARGLRDTSGGFRWAYVVKL
jgi:hypothetical protein